MPMTSEANAVVLELKCPVEDDCLHVKTDVIHIDHRIIPTQLYQEMARNAGKRTYLSVHANNLEAAFKEGRELTPIEHELAHFIPFLINITTGVTDVDTGISSRYAHTKIAVGDTGHIDSWVVFSAPFLLYLLNHDRAIVESIPTYSSQIRMLLDEINPYTTDLNADRTFYSHVKERIVGGADLYSNLLLPFIGTFYDTYMKVFTIDPHYNTDALYEMTVSEVFTPKLVISLCFDGGYGDDGDDDSDGVDSDDGYGEE
jgi:hypothetical protein